jgi:hypothetical protein
MTPEGAGRVLQGRLYANIARPKCFCCEDVQQWQPDSRPAARSAWSYKPGERLACLPPRAASIGKQRQAVTKSNSGIPDVARLEKLERECAEAITRHDGDLTIEFVNPPVAGELLITYRNKAGAVLDNKDPAVQELKTRARTYYFEATGKRVNDDRWIHLLFKQGIGTKRARGILSDKITEEEFKKRRAAGGDVEGYKPVELIKPVKASLQSGNEPTFDLNNPPRKAHQYQEYPRMLYRKGKTYVVQSARELRKMLAQGWSKDPPRAPGKALKPAPPPPYRYQEFQRAVYHHEHGISCARSQEQLDQLLAQGWREEPPAADQRGYVRTVQVWRIPNAFRVLQTLYLKRRYEAEAGMAHLETSANESAMHTVNAMGASPDRIASSVEASPEQPPRLPTVAAPVRRKKRGVKVNGAELQMVCLQVDFNQASLTQKGLGLTTIKKAFNSGRLDERKVLLIIDTLNVQLKKRNLALLNPSDLTLPD